MHTSFRVVLLLSVVLLLAPGIALGYGGPGSVISGIGALLAAVAALFATLFGFLWFPLKRLYRRMTAEENAPGEETASEPVDR
jgi:Kef-type K+ transport system membrane component KefB